MTRLIGAILAGGQSRRMGENKALLRLDPDGETVIASVARKLHQVTDEIVLVGADPEPYAFLDLPWLTDATSGAGPLAGIQAALAGAEGTHVLVVGCDLPFLSVNLLRFMAGQLRDYDVLVPVLERPQPLHAIYAPTCLPLIDAALGEGRFKVTGWFDRAKVRELDAATIATHDPTLRSCFNLNTPEDLALAREILRVDVVTDEPR